MNPGIDEIVRATCNACGHQAEAELFLDVIDVDFSRVRSGTIHWSLGGGKAVLSCPECGSLEIDIDMFEPDAVT